MTIQLEYFVKSARFIRVFEWNTVYVWALGIQTFQLPKRTQVPLSSDK